MLGVWRVVRLRYAWWLASRSDLMQLRAPVDGTVQQLAVHTEGDVVTEAQPLLVVVPTND